MLSPVMGSLITVALLLNLRAPWVKLGERGEAEAEVAEGVKVLSI